MDLSLNFLNVGFRKNKESIILFVFNFYFLNIHNKHLLNIFTFTKLFKEIFQTNNNKKKHKPALVNKETDNINLIKKRRLFKIMFHSLIFFYFK